MATSLFRRPLTPQEIGDLSRQLSTFLRAGVPILEALEVMAVDASNPQLRDLLRDVARRLAAGESFAEAIAAEPGRFPPYYAGMIGSAELNGRLDVVLEQLAEYIDRDEQVKRKVRGALIYPGILLVMTIVVMTILVGYVLPKFSDFFAGFGSDLPRSTQLMLSLGDVVARRGPLMFLVTVVAVGGFVVLARTERGKLSRNRLALRTPIIRNVVQAATIERFCRILGAMVRAGVPISSGMAAAIDSAGNRVFRARLVLAAEDMLQGRGFTDPLVDTGLFPATVTRMMRVGEETGTLDLQLELAATYYERELSQRLERLTALFEPAVTIAMGLGIGLVSLSLVQAMYGVYSSSGVG